MGEGKEGLGGQLVKCVEWKTGDQCLVSKLCRGDWWLVSEVCEMCGGDWWLVSKVCEMCGGDWWLVSKVCEMCRGDHWLVH